MAGGNAGLASGAAVERNLESILLAIAGFGERDQAAIVIRQIRLVLVMDFRKPGDRGLELFLLGQQLIDEISLLGVGL